MSIFTKSLLLLGMPLMAMSANAESNPVDNHGTDLTKFVYKAKNSRNVFASPRQTETRNIDARMMLRTGAFNSAEPAPGFGPVNSITATETFGDIDFPGGETWFYTVDTEYNYIQHNEYWTEAILKGYTIKIYNEKRELVGTIEDDFPYLADETRVPYFDVTPIITKNFFNDDDKYEVMVGAAINTDAIGYVRYRTYIYQIDPESTEITTDFHSTIDGMVSDVCDATLPGGEENVYMTFTREHLDADESYEELYEKWQKNPKDVDWWNDWFMKQLMEIEVYGKADASGELQSVLNYSIPMQCLPGDQESTPMLMSIPRDGRAYFVCSQYAQSFYNPHGMGYNEALTMREENGLVIEVFKVTGMDHELIQTTSIPVTKAVNEDVLASYYSVGDFRYRDDVRWREDGLADFFITVSNYVTSSDESSPKGYYAYSAEGSLQATLATDVMGTRALSDIEGFEPQQMFVTYQNNTLTYSFVNLISFEQPLALDYMLQVYGDPDPMTTNLDRVAHGDSYAYVAEMRYPLEDDGQAFMRFAWLADDGSFIRFDQVNLGTNIMYAQSYLSGQVLRPGYYVSGDVPAYMILLKRGQGDGTNQEELLIAEACTDEYPEGRDLLLLGPCDKGVLSSIYPVSSGESNSLVVIYVSDNAITVDTYALPLDKDSSSVGGIATDSKAPVFVYDGATVTVSGEAPVHVIDLQGRMVASGNGSVFVGNLASGVYVVESNGTSRKLFVK